MQPKSPVLTAEFQPSEVVYAKDQPEYLPLPAMCGADGLVTTRWEFTAEEREAIAKGADILLSVYTYNHPLQPLRMEVAIPENVIRSGIEHGLVVLGLDPEV